MVLKLDAVLVYIHQQFKGACHLSFQGLRRPISITILEKLVYVLCKGNWSSSVTHLTGAVAPWFCQLHSRLVLCNYYPNHLNLYNILFCMATLVGLLRHFKWRQRTLQKCQKLLTIWHCIISQKMVTYVPEFFVVEM